MTDTAKQASVEIERLPRSAASELHGRIYRKIWQMAKERRIELPDGDCSLEFLIQYVVDRREAALRKGRPEMTDYPHGMETGIAPEQCLCQACKHWRAQNAALREEVERLRSLVTRALILAGGYSTEQRRFWNELIEAGEAELREGQKGSE